MGFKGVHVLLLKYMSKQDLLSSGNGFVSPNNIIVIKLSKLTRTGKIMNTNFVKTALNRAGPELINSKLTADSEKVRPEFFFWGMSYQKYQNKIFNKCMTGDYVLFIYQGNNPETEGKAYLTIFNRANFLNSPALSQCNWQDDGFAGVFWFNILESRKINSDHLINQTMRWTDKMTGAKLVTSEEAHYQSIIDELGEELINRVQGQKQITQDLASLEYIGLNQVYHVLYFVTPTEYVMDGSNKYKIGQTTQRDPLKYLRQAYGRKYKVHFIRYDIPAEQLTDYEQACCLLLEENFGKPCRGREYFQGSLPQMIYLLNNYIHKRLYPTEID